MKRSELGFHDALQLLERGGAELFERAQSRRDELFGSVLTYSPKVFLPVTNLCRDRCSYCTFRKGPKDDGAHTMSLDEVRAVCRKGKALGCTEALLCLGDRPESVFPSYRRLLGQFGFPTTPAYLVEVSRVCLEEGLLPHTNAGLLTGPEMLDLRRYNVSMGLMLENIADRLCRPGGPHESAPDKLPAKRQAMLEEAGRLRIPFTSGILVGIGETRRERLEALFWLRDLQRRFGHLQEVIVQIFRAKTETKMSRAAEVSDEELFRTAAVARLVLDDISLQAPPNLTPEGHRGLIEAGLNDWGGISPLTRDFINPEAPWPHLEALARDCREAGFELRPRLPVYPKYLAEGDWIDPRLREEVPDVAVVG